MAKKSRCEGPPDLPAGRNLLLAMLTLSLLVPGIWQFFGPTRACSPPPHCHPLSLLFPSCLLRWEALTCHYWNHCFRPLLLCSLQVSASFVLGPGTGTLIHATWSHNLQAAAWAWHPSLRLDLSFSKCGPCCIGVTWEIQAPESKPWGGGDPLSSCCQLLQVTFFFFFKDFYLFIHERHRERKRGRDTGGGRSRLHAGSRARCGTRSLDSRIAPWAKGRR